jgi:hypothetical protein
MMLRVVMNSTRSSSLLTKGEGWWESREEEEEPRRGEECETMGEGRGGVVERRDVVRERGEVAHNRVNCLRDQTTRPYSHRGLRVGRGR